MALLGGKRVDSMHRVVHTYPNLSVEQYQPGKNLSSSKNSKGTFGWLGSGLEDDVLRGLGGGC
jgi:hypothetical protein